MIQNLVLMSPHLVRLQKSVTVNAGNEEDEDSEQYYVWEYEDIGNELGDDEDEDAESERGGDGDEKAAHPHLQEDEDTDGEQEAHQ